MSEVERDDVRTNAATVVSEQEGPASVPPAKGGEKAAKAKKEKKKSAGVGFFELLLVAAVASSLGAVASVAYMKREMAATIQQQTIYVVDTNTIVDAKVNEFLGNLPNLPEDQMRAQMEAFTKRLNDALVRYSEEGVLMIAQGAVVTSPVGANKTEEVAKVLGVDLALAKRPVSWVNPSLAADSAPNPQAGQPAPAAPNGVDESHKERQQ